MKIEFNTEWPWYIVKDSNNKIIQSIKNLEEVKGKFWKRIALLVHTEWVVEFNHINYEKILQKNI